MMFDYLPLSLPPVKNIEEIFHHISSYPIGTPRSHYFDIVTHTN